MANETESVQSIHQIMLEIGRRARLATRLLATAGAEAKSVALRSAAQNIRSEKDRIQSANDRDVDAGQISGLTSSMLDRLRLDADRIESIALGLESIAEIEDPIGEVMSEWVRPNGLMIQRVRTPLGVVGVIYESRPNVTADAGGLCLKAGNAVILRGGSDSVHSSRAIHRCLLAGLKSAELPVDAIQIVPTTDRAAVGELLSGLGGNLDVLVPRGGKNLVARVQEESRVPVFAHLEGICHVYIDASADPEMAREIVVNSKMRRTGICGAAETVLIDRSWVGEHLSALLDALQSAGCQIRGDETVVKLPAPGPLSKSANEEDWSTEYLDAILSVKVVDGLEDAIKHINHFGSHHTESIITETPASVQRFFNEVDSAILLHNASTQFADGGEFGMGAEIGIATGKMHARGPVGVEQLTSFNYRVHGNGQIRPE